MNEKTRGICFNDMKLPPEMFRSIEEWLLDVGAIADLNIQLIDKAIFIISILRPESTVFTDRELLDTITELCYLKKHMHPFVNVIFFILEISKKGS